MFNKNGKNGDGSWQKSDNRRDYGYQPLNEGWDISEHKGYQPIITQTGDDSLPPTGSDAEDA